MTVVLLDDNPIMHPACSGQKGHRQIQRSLGQPPAHLANTRDTVLADPGPLLELWVGIELWKRLQYLGRGSLSYYRTKGGAEVDFIVERGGRITPIEVKWTDAPTLDDARHLRRFLADHRKQATMGYIVCRTDRRRVLADDVTAIPWWSL